MDTTAVTTLADSLLDDLDDLSDVEPEEIESETSERKEDNNELTRTSGFEETRKSKKRKLLLDDSSLKSLLDQIGVLLLSSNQYNLRQKSTEEEESDHKLILNCNRYLHSLSIEMSIAHSELSEAYRPKFPELEDLVVDPMQYKNTVDIIQNETDITKISHQLNQILNSNQVLTISVAATTTNGKKLSPEQLSCVNDASMYMQQVFETTQKLTQFIESRVVALCPNVCALVGSKIAALLLGLSGGLAELSKIPACNLQVVGQVKQNTTSQAGLSSTGLYQQMKHQRKTFDGGVANIGNNMDMKTMGSETAMPSSLTSPTVSSVTTSLPHVGVIGDCDLVQKKCPAYLQKKVMKAVAAKLALAIRCDYVAAETGRPRTSESGLKFRAEIENKIRKWEEPDKAPVVKALPKPDLTTKKRRGGKRVRRMKERFEETELMKQANKRAFSAQTGEYGDDAMGLTLGMLDTKESIGGVLKKPTSQKKMRIADTKASRKAAQQRAMKGLSSGATNGLASSMVFTPVQGLELVNPDANRDKVREANAKWFAEKNGFQSALPKSK